MKGPERIAAVRKLAGGSTEDEAFVRDFFPDLYRQAFLSPRRAEGGRSGSAHGVREPQRIARGKSQQSSPFDNQRSPAFASVLATKYF